MLTVAVGALALGIVKAPDWGWTGDRVLAAWFIAVALGVALLERSPRGISLTPPGRALLGHAEALLARLDDAERDVIEIARQGGGQLRLVAFPTAAATVVPLMSVRFLGEYLAHTSAR